MMLFEYIWLDSRENIRSKCKIGENLELEKWSFDGSSTDQATTEKSDIIINPVKKYKHPFYKNYDSYIVLCECETNDDSRKKIKDVFEKGKDLEPWYGFEQEFFILTSNGTVLGIEDAVSQGQYYCANGWENCFEGRIILDKFVEYCILANIKICGTNAEVAPGQWEYQIGPLEGIEAADQLIISRFILIRTAEELGYSISLHPKLLGQNWNGSGCHTNFSTKLTRNPENGLSVIKDNIKKLGEKHKEAMKIYGKCNHLRLTGKHETSSMETFSYSESDRGRSVRIGALNMERGYGYFEDRRPASNMNPYLVSGHILECILE